MAGDRAPSSTRRPRAFSGVARRSWAQEFAGDQMHVNADHDALPRTLLDPTAARSGVLYDPDGTARESGRLRRAFPVSRLAATERLRHRPDHRGQRRPAHALTCSRWLLDRQDAGLVGRAHHRQVRPAEPGRAGRETWSSSPNAASPSASCRPRASRDTIRFTWPSSSRGRPRDEPCRDLRPTDRNG